MDHLPLLEAAFAENVEQLRNLALEDPYGWDLRTAEGLLNDAGELGVRGIEKLQRNAGSFSKFTALLSELRIANLFARLGFDVTLLLDEAFGRGRIYTPDLLVAKQDLRFLVDVVQGSSGRPDIAGPLDQALKAHGLRFRVAHRLGEQFSIPGITGEERGRTEQAICSVVTRLVEHLRALPHPQHGTTTIDGHRFDYRPSLLEEGFVGGGVTAVHWLRTEEHASKFLRDLERKAEKQKRLPPAKRSIPFVVAYDNRESEFTPEAALTALTGSRCFLMGSEAELKHERRINPVCHPPHVLSALAGSWRGLLEEWDFGPDANRYRFTEYGALVSATWASTLSGVLVTHVIDRVQWFPNPFAAGALCDPRLLGVGLPFRGLRESHPAWHRYP